MHGIYVIGRKQHKGRVKFMSYRGVRSCSVWLAEGRNREPISSNSRGTAEQWSSCWSHVPFVAELV